MDPITQQTILAAAGAGGDKVYVDDVFRTTLYKGTGGVQTIVTGLDNTTKSLLWIKDRTQSYPQYIYDTIRGHAKFIHTSSAQNDQNDASGPGGSAVILQSFTNNGFTTGSDSAQINANGDNLCSWNFLAAPGFMDVVRFTGNGATSGSPLTVNHDLGSAPGMIWVKNLTTANTNWFVYHRSLGVNKFMLLNLTNSVNNYNGGFANITSSSFQVYDSNATNGSSFMAYIFAHDDAQFGTGGDESIIKCDTYTSTSGSGPLEVNVGFEPQWVMIKNTGSSSAYAPWIMFDNMRGIYAGDVSSSSYGHDPALSANYAAEEGTTYNYNANFIDLTPTGFNVFASNTPVNVSGGNFIYMAIRRANKPPEVGTDVFAVDTKSEGRPAYTSNFPVDLVFNRNNITSLDSTSVETRLTGKQLVASSSGINTFDLRDTFRSNTGWDNGGGVDTTDYAWMFKRAPGFMDVVTYKGTGVTRTVNHNLTVKPELMIIKIRSHSFNWITYDKINSATKYMSLNSNNGGIVSSSIFNNTEPTSSVFTVAGASGNVNYDGGYLVAYLFATLSGISKVGSYAGTGNAVNVDCGFTNGARFILIKRTNTGTTGDWYVWDSLRGIVSGNDPYVLLNTNTAQVTNTDYIDPLSAGFTVTSSAPAALNTSGGTYLFLAIA